MKNILVKISYDGSYFHGWQIQENAHTVQEEFQSALYKIIGEKADIKACSRTDSGVHANVFCISVKTESKITPERLKGALNHYFPLYMACLSAEEVPMDFHARYSCKGKEYVYLIHNAEVRNPFLKDRALHYYHKIDEEKLNTAASYYIGTHDFTSFCTQDAREMEDMRRTVYDAKVTREGDIVKFTVSADGFLYNMVRIMVGTLIRVQEGKIKPEEIPSILEKKNRAFAGPTAPPEGLYLNKVFY